MNPDLSASSVPQADDQAPARRLPWLVIGGAGVLAGLAGLAWFTRADALFLELASAALAMCF